MIQTRDLPARYYLTHFNEMLGSVEARYAAVLAPAHRSFLTDFAALPVDARCLYVRMANRKGTAFRPCDLDRYREIENNRAALECLHGAGFAGTPESGDHAALVDALKKPELLALLGPAARPSWSRKRLVETAGNLDAALLMAALPGLVLQRRVEALAYLRFLYFGRLEHSLTRFALRDMGLVKAPERRETYTPRFDTREEAEAAFFYANRLAALKGADALRWAAEAPGWPPATGAQAEAARDTLLAGLGARLERIDRAAARRVYGLGASPDCNERAVRLAHAEGDLEETRARLEAMIADPGSETEALFADDFLARKFGGVRCSDVTRMLREAPVIRLDESWRGAPEAGAAKWFSGRGAGRVWHGENHIWRALFALVLWEPLFEAEDAALHNEFERLPAILRHGGALQGEAVERALAVLDTPERAVGAVLGAIARHYGAPNGLFGWHEDLGAMMTALIRGAPPGGLATVLRAMARDYRQVKDGFPDLMIVEDGRARFVEIKAEGDQVRRHQLARLALLRRAGFDASVARVEWFVDPAQPYTVVDVETTGGRAATHRITEIGAVRVRGGRIEDQWSSLVNPARPIPKFITGLTGITDAMVADAPRFEAVADAFDDFVGDSVFVAHNARFDYSFIGAEFARLDRSFRRPTLCTCQSARALWKGLPSYGLASLCAHFGIALTRHHRALADAEATAGLLLRINDARSALNTNCPASPLPGAPLDA